MAEKNLIDQREYEQTVEFIEEFHLGEHRPQLVSRLRGINIEHPTSLDVHLWQTIAADVKAFRAFHEQYPFAVAPPGIIATGEIDTGLVQIADNQPLRVTRDEPFRHTGIFGMTGAAKTTLAQTYAEHLKTAGFHLHIIDGKRDSEHFVTRHDDMLLLTPDMPIPLLDREYLGAEHARLLVRTLRRTMYGGEGLEQVATEALATTYERHPRPSLVDLHRVLLGMERKGDTYTRRDRINGLALRIGRIIESFPGWSTTPAGAGLDLDMLRTHSWYFGFTTQTSTEDFLSTFVIEWLFARKRLLNDRTTSNVVFIDEAVPIFHDDTISGDAPLAPTLGLLREFRIGILLTANNVRALPAALKSNLYLQVVMNLSDHAEASEVAKTFGLTREEQEFLKHDLTRGTALCFLADRWRHTILATFAPPTTDKVVHSAEWDAAKQRTKTLAREVTSDTAATGTMDSQPATLSTPPAPTSAAPVEKTSPNSAVLNQKQRTYLATACELGAPIVTELNERLGMHPMEADRIRKKIGPQGLGLLHETRITVGGGRGKQATCLTPSETAYNMLGIKKPHLGRGSGPQHAWLLRTLAQRIPATIEVSGADLALVLDHEKHGRFIAALRSLGCGDIPPNGTAIAIEAELLPARTAKPNLDRDHEYALVIIATPKNELQTAKRISKDYQNAIVIDVFALLDALQEERS